MSNTITRVKGDTYSIEVVITKNSLPLDFTDGTTAILSFEKGSTKVSINGINGTVDGEISFPFVGQELVKVGQYRYDIQVTSLSGEIRTYVTSTLTIVNDVSE